jgi:hypothetical protein
VSRESWLSIELVWMKAPNLSSSGYDISLQIRKLPSRKKSQNSWQLGLFRKSYILTGLPTLCWYKISTRTSGACASIIRISINIAQRTRLVYRALITLSFLNCYSGYHQIVLRVEDQSKTSFITPFGAYCYTTMSFGLKNARATYQRAI